MEVVVSSMEALHRQFDDSSHPESLMVRDPQQNNVDLDNISSILRTCLSETGMLRDVIS